MPIVFHGEIEKIEPQKSYALRKLRLFLNKNEPQLAFFLQTLWRNQGNAITYKQLREWILAGDISIELLEEWEQDYSKFVNKYMKPLYDAAIMQAAERVTLQYPDYHYSAIEFVQAYTDKYSARFVTNSTNEQIMAIRQLVKNAATLGDMTVDKLSRAIRPTVGLTRQQARAYANYHRTLIESGLSPKNALDKALRYRQRQHRYRGYNIARTELAFAYNDAEYRSVIDAQQKGYMGHTVKKWSSAGDERVCHICKSLDGMKIEVDEEFPYSTKLPAYTRLTAPAHPSCRCAIVYIETAPPQYGPEFYVSGAAAETDTFKSLLQKTLIEKYNPNHDELGRFSSGGAALSGTTGASKSEEITLNGIVGNVDKEELKSVLKNSVGLDNFEEKYNEFKDMTIKEMVTSYEKIKPKQFQVIRRTNEEIKSLKVSKPSDIAYNSETRSQLGTMKDDVLTQQVMKDLNVSNGKATEFIDEIRAYTKNGYKATRDLNDTSINAAYSRKAIEDFIKGSPKYDGNIYRGLKFDKEAGENFLKQLSDGSEIDMKGISSWSSSKEYAETNAAKHDLDYKVVLSCENKTGIGIEHISTMPEEREVLQSGNSRFKATKINRSGNNYFVEVEEI